MRKLCSFAIPCAAAIFAAVYLLPETLLLPAAGICTLAALLGLLLRGDPRLRAVLLTLGLAAGFLWTAGYDLIFYAPARWLAGTEGTFTATVTDYPAPTRYGSSVQADLHTGRGPDVGIILYASQEEYGALRPGDRITFPAQLRLADTSYGEETDYYRSRGIFLPLLRPGGGPHHHRPDYRRSGWPFRGRLLCPPAHRTGPYRVRLRPARELFGRGGGHPAGAL